MIFLIIYIHKNHNQFFYKKNYMSSKKEILVITKDTINRLLGDIKNILKNPLNEHGIYYQHDDEDMLKGYAVIIGPKETPYFGGNYFFEFTYPADYPHSPPKVTYKTNGDNIRFNPNLYTNGKVCISILNTWRGEQWTSCQTISTVLLTLCSLLCNDPLLNEPGIHKDHSDLNKYTKIIEYKNIDIAVLKMVDENDSYYPVNFRIFYPIVREQFLKNKDEMEKMINEKIVEQCNNVVVLNTRLYNMDRISIDYINLKKQFLEVCEKIAKKIELEK